jgi:hypothetical protein
MKQYIAAARAPASNRANKKFLATKRDSAQAYRDIVVDCNERLKGSVAKLAGQTFSAC